MKNKFLLMTLLLTIVSLNLTYAQGKQPKPKVLKTSFGIKAGVNMSTITKGQSTIDLTPNMLMGFNAGAVVNMHFGHRNEGSPVGTGFFGLQPELLFSTQGFKTEDVTINLSYISVPIMIKLYIAKGLNIELGPYLSYLMAVSPNTTVIDGAQIGISAIKGGFDYGASAGIGYEFKFGLTIGARYNLGLTEMAENLPWKNNAIAASIGWLF